MPKKSQDTSWQSVAPWYNKLVGNEGHYYHEHLVLPGAIRLLNLQPESRLLDLGCGQGILARRIKPIAEYVGLDKAPALIAEARKANHRANYDFQVSDVTRPFKNVEPTFTHAAIILALQNMAYPGTALTNAAKYLQPGGKLVIVLNHPCFRIPRQSGWGVDDNTKQQYRWMNRYRSELKIPITMNPGKNESAVTWSFHHSLEAYSQMLLNAGFVITKLEEWTSDKESVGKTAKMENRARSEFPLFLAIQAEKRN